MPLPETPSEDLLRCVAVEDLFASRLLRIFRWQCLVDGEPLAAERCHGSYVLGLVHAGASVLHWPGGSALTDPGSVIFHHPGSPYWTSHPYGCGDRGCHVALDEALARGLLAEHGLDADVASPQPAVVSPRPRGAYLHQHLLLSRRRLAEPLEPTEVEGGVLELAEEALAAIAARRGRRRPRRLATRRAHRLLAEDARAVLFERFTEPLQVDDVARAVHASPFHLCRVFQRATGWSLHRYLTRLRLLAALEEVADGRDDLAGLAFDLGFSSHSHLSAAFRKELGLPPSEVRRRAGRRRLAQWRSKLELGAASSRAR